MNFYYNDDGCLVSGIYDVSLNEFEDEFVNGKSQRRQEIYKYYKNHLKEIESTNCCLNHWIDGSFVTLKDNPGDIDTFTEFDGEKVEILGIQEYIEDIIYNAPLKTRGYCHSLFVFKFPKSQKDDFDDYLKYKSKVLFLLFPINHKSKNLKGFLKIKKVN